MIVAEPWHGRALTLEAAMMLTAARALIALVAFRRWRATLGRSVEPGPANPEARLPDNRRARRLVRAVARAGRRLPGEPRCLEQAMALAWMLRRRGIASVLVLGVRPGVRRGGLDDLHAWVVREGEILIGLSDGDHRPIAAFRS